MAVFVFSTFFACFVLRPADLLRSRETVSWAVEILVKQISIFIF